MSLWFFRCGLSCRLCFIYLDLLIPEHLLASYGIHGLYALNGFEQSKLDLSRFLGGIFRYVFPEPSLVVLHNVSRHGDQTAMDLLAMSEQESIGIDSN